MRDETPHPDAGGGESEQASQQQIVVDDPEDFAKTRQLKTIFDAADDFIQARDDVEGMEGPKSSKIVFRKLQDFAMSTQPLLASTELGQEILEERTYGTDARFVAKCDLASFEGAKAGIKESAREFLGAGFTVSEVKAFFDGLRIDVPESRLREAVASLDKHGVGARRRQESATQPAGASLFDAHSDDPRRINVSRLVSDIQQLGADGADPQPLETQTDALVDFVFEKDRLEYTTYKKIKHQARVASTVWGWEVEGARSLLGEMPKLAYEKKHESDFGTTPPPQWVSSEVFVDIQSAITDLGLGVSFSEDNQTKIDDDLLNEVEKWRQGKGN